MTLPSDITGGGKIKYQAPPPNAMSGCNNTHDIDRVPSAIALAIGASAVENTRSGVRAPHNVEDLPMTDERGKPRPSGTIEH